MCHSSVERKWLLRRPLVSSFFLVLLVPITYLKAYHACDGIESQVHSLSGLSFCDTLPLPVKILGYIYT